MTPCTISLGSNTDDREYQIDQAINGLGAYLSRCSVSEIYETEALNGKDSPYLNAVIHGFTSHSTEEVNAYLKQWEADHGRTLEEKAEGKVRIDLDLVIWDCRILRPDDFGRHYFNRGYRELLANGAYLTD